MHAEHDKPSFPELMTQLELIDYLRIPEVSTASNDDNVIDNLKRFHGVPCIHTSYQPLSHGSRHSPLG